VADNRDRIEFIRHRIEFIGAEIQIEANKDYCSKFARRNQFKLVAALDRDRRWWQKQLAGLNGEAHDNDAGGEPLSDPTDQGDRVEPTIASLLIGSSAADTFRLPAETPQPEERSVDEQHYEPEPPSVDHRSSPEGLEDFGGANTSSVSTKSAVAPGASGAERPIPKPLFDQGFTIRDSPDVLTIVEPVRSGRSAKRLDVLTADELLAMSFPAREMILAPWLQQKGLAMIYGPRGIGKTHLTLGCAYAIASGGTFLRWRAPRPRRVLVIDGEMPAVTLQSRLASIFKMANETPPEPTYLRFLAMDLQTGRFDLENDADQRAIESDLADVDMIFVDNISTLARLGRENEADAWLPVQEWALEQRRAGRGVVFLHHSGKSGGQRGTSRREDVLDAVIKLQHPQNYRADEGARFEVVFEKNRGFFGDDAQSFEATLGADGWTLRDAGNTDPDAARMVRIMEMAGRGMSQRETATALNIPKAKVQRLLERARSEPLGRPAGKA
jgi:AAA domain